MARTGVVTRARALAMVAWACEAIGRVGAVNERGFAAAAAQAKGRPKPSGNVSALSLHEAVEGHVSRTPALRELALTAFQSFVRAYSAHSAELKIHFPVRSLHLGHVARSFALQDAPTTIKQVVPKQQT